MECSIVGTPPDPDVSHLIAMRQDQYEKHQAMEATNRWKELELQTPGHNLNARQHKVDVASKKSQPKVSALHGSNTICRKLVLNWKHVMSI